MQAIETEGLTRRFGDVVAVDGLNLSVESGEIYGFLGPNGAGKTTTINLLLGLVYPTSGHARVLGRPVGEDVHDTHGRIGVLPAHTELYERLTARKHLEFAIRVKDADDDPDELLERVGIPDAADRPAGEFSTGMGQRLKLAMALVDQPDLLILDEPTTGLDPNGAREMREIIRTENDRGATVFFSSHIMGQVEAVCDRIGILDRGRLVAEDTIDALRETGDADARLTVEVERPSTDLAETVRALESVSGVQVDGSTVDVSLSEADGKGPAMTAIADASRGIVDFEFEEQELEDLFARYTEGSEPATSQGQSQRNAKPLGEVSD
jgi:ABC-2 type transport system ATP-binding protein